MPTTNPIFYSLPVEQVTAGMSTDDGQDFLEDVHQMQPASAYGVWYWGKVYTPRSDDEEQDEQNRLDSESRMYEPGSRVSLGVFPDTEVDGSALPDAIRKEG